MNIFYFTTLQEDYNDRMVVYDSMIIITILLFVCIVLCKRGPDLYKHQKGAMYYLKLGEQVVTYDKVYICSSCDQQFTVKDNIVPTCVGSGLGLRYHHQK